MKIVVTFTNLYQNCWWHRDCTNQIIMNVSAIMVGVAHPTFLQVVLRAP